MALNRRARSARLGRLGRLRRIDQWPSCASGTDGTGGPLVASSNVGSDPFSVEDGPDIDGVQARPRRPWFVRETELRRPMRPPRRSEPASGHVGTGRPPRTVSAITVTDGGRTVVVGTGRTGEATAAQARLRDPLEVADNPYGRAATVLGRPLVARLYPGPEPLHRHRQGERAPPGARPRVAASVGRLQPYEVLGVGYSGTGTDGGIVGRYAFDYARPRQAEADLAGRSRLSFTASPRAGIGVMTGSVHRTRPSADGGSSSTSRRQPRSRR